MGGSYSPLLGIQLQIPLKATLQCAQVVKLPNSYCPVKLTLGVWELTRHPYLYYETPLDSLTAGIGTFQCVRQICTHCL